jgi:hypothetical protein
MQTTEHQRVAIVRKQRIATLLGKINVHIVGNGLLAQPFDDGTDVAGASRPFRNQP